MALAVGRRLGSDPGSAGRAIGDRTWRLQRGLDGGMRFVLLASALLSLVIVILIFAFTLLEALPVIREIGIGPMLEGDVWRPQQRAFGLMPMILGSIYVTIGAVILGVPLALGAAIFLAEVAPPAVHGLVRPAVELLAGIPSVVYGLFGMVVLVPLVRQIPVPGNSGFGILPASVVLAVMILPTITNISEDALRSVPREYKEASLALGATRWQTIVGVILPSARSGIVASVILGIGRALGETMAMIMVIGNSVTIPTPLTDNPATLALRQARTLTGNIAVEINYATGIHANALFATGVVLFVMIMSVNTVARVLSRGGNR